MYHQGFTPQTGKRARGERGRGTANGNTRHAWKQYWRNGKVDTWTFKVRAPSDWWVSLWDQRFLSMLHIWKASTFITLCNPSISWNSYKYLAMYLNLYQTKTSNIYQIKNVKLSSESNADIDHGRSVDRILSITCTSLLNLKKEKKITLWWCWTWLNVWL